MIDPTELVLDAWPTTDADWSRAFDDNSIPPATVRRALAFDISDPLLTELQLPTATVSADGAPPEGHPVVVTFRDLKCPECDRGVVVVYKPWGLEPRQAMLNEIRGGLEAMAWHDRHPR
jgi:hypothetical protein